jgi:hypothetical protein
MPRRKKLKGIASNLIHSLNSRNNDYLGYWATGQLYKLASDSQVDKVVINVINESIEPESKTLSSLAKNYKSFIEGQLITSHLPLEILKKVIIEYKFNQEHNPRIHDSIGTGKPYIIKLTIVTDTKHEFIEEAGGYCKEHDPSKEQRSLRANASNK